MTNYGLSTQYIETTQVQARCLGLCTGVLLVYGSVHICAEIIHMTLDIEPSCHLAPSTCFRQMKGRMIYLEQGAHLPKLSNFLIIFL